MAKNAVHVNPSAPMRQPTSPAAPTPVPVQASTDQPAPTPVPYSLPRPQQTGEPKTPRILP